MFGNPDSFSVFLRIKLPIFAWKRKRRQYFIIRLVYERKMWLWHRICSVVGEERKTYLHRKMSEGCFMPYRRYGRDVEREY